MSGDTPLKFGTNVVAAASIISDAKLLRLHILEGTLNADELEMLIKFLQAKRDQLDAL